MRVGVVRGGKPYYRDTAHGPVARVVTGHTNGGGREGGRYKRLRPEDGIALERLKRPAPISAFRDGCRAASFSIYSTDAAAQCPARTGASARYRAVTLFVA